MDATPRKRSLGERKARPAAAAGERELAKVKGKAAGGRKRSTG